MRPVRRSRGFESADPAVKRHRGKVTASFLKRFGASFKGFRIMVGYVLAGLAIREDVKRSIDYLAGLVSGRNWPSIPPYLNTPYSTSFTPCPLPCSAGPLLPE